jgi:hypothetical protein
MAWGEVLGVVAVEWEGVQEGGIFEGLGMNEEGRRALGRGEAQRFTVDGFLELYVQYVHAPCLYLLSPSRCPSWCPGTGPDHMSRSVFGLHRLQVHLMS